MLYVREKRTTVGQSYMEVDIYSRDTAQDEPVRRGTRKRKKKVTQPAQANLNEKNARRYLTQLANGNFAEGDLFVTLTYAPENTPATERVAEHHVTNFLRRVAYRRKKLELEPLKYILVTEYKQDEEGRLTGRLHHHLLMSGMDRDLLESLWAERKKPIGYVRTQRLHPDRSETGNGIERLVTYITKDPKGRKRWSSSRNLKRPVETKNDHKYSRKKVRLTAEDQAAGYMFYSAKYPGWEIVTPIEYRLNELTGEWAAYLKMWRRQEKIRR
jgi:hypothetical protein